MKKIVYLDFDDFGEQNNRLDWFWMLKNEFSNFKVNMFAIPEQNKNIEWREYLKSLEWIQLCVHGYWHHHDEEIPEIMLRDEFPMKDFAKVYRAPYWELSDKMFNILKKLKYKIMLHPDDPRKGIKYNWNIKYSPPNLDILYGHGHIQDVCENGIVEVFENIMKLPKETEFRFL